MNPYAPRPIRFQGLVRHEGWILKWYAIAKTSCRCASMVRDQEPQSQWRAARASESFCVWDLQVIGFERDAYVKTVLAPDADDRALERYLAASFSVHEGESVAV